MELATPHAVQARIIEEFQTLAGNRANMLTYIMDLGEQLPPLHAQYKTEHNTIKGCLSTVWLTYKKQADRVFFEGDSNTAITKGLISLLFRILSGQKIPDIIHTNLHFVHELDLLQLIGSQRASGFANMVKEIKLIAIAQSVTQIP